jgi:hypothetical protein
MPAFTFRVPEIPLARPGTPIGVFRFEPGVGYEPLSGIKPHEITFREGAEPSKAVFEYLSSNYRPDLIPVGFERVLPLVRVGDPLIVSTDDRIVVAALLPDGSLRFLFDGFAQVPEGKFTDSQETVTFVAQGVEFRLWDSVLGYAWYRDAGDPTNPTANVRTCNPLRFNPKVGEVSRGNRIADGFEADSESGRPCSVFVDPLLRLKKVTVEGEEISICARWDLFTAVNYLMTIGNPDEEYVKVQDVDYLSDLLSVYRPKAGSYFDPDDPASYEKKPIDITDMDFTGDTWPEAVAKLVEANGYAMCFRLGDDGESPVTWLDIYKINDNAWTDYKDLYLQQWNEALDPGASSLGAGRFANDISNIVNVVWVDTAPVRHEAGFLLAPLFEVDAADLSADNKEKFKKTNKDFHEHYNDYRLFGVDETGDGHLKQTIAGPGGDGLYWFSVQEWVDDIFDLEPLFGTDEEGNPRFVERRRPPLSELWSEDKQGAKLKATLYISVDYISEAPGIWDGTSGTWTKVGGQFELCKDRLGIRVTADNPNAWHIGKMPKGTPEQIAAGDVRLMDWLASADPQKRKAFTLMLVCVVESDQNLGIVAQRREVCPTQFEINRIIDMRSKLRPGKIETSSYFHPDRGQTGAEAKDTGEEETVATEYAIAKRESRQLGRWSGAATIPRLTDAYAIGDRVRRIEGRFTSMQTNLDANGQEAPTYPRVIGITYNLSTAQTTDLVLTDQRSDHNEQL